MNKNEKYAKGGTKRIFDRFLSKRGGSRERKRTTKGDKSYFSIVVEGSSHGRDPGPLWDPVQRCRVSKVIECGNEMAR